MYDKNYWADYYDGDYAETFQYAFDLENILSKCWDKTFRKRPISFADIGCGPGHTLVLAEKSLPGASVYGVECQEIPNNQIVHPEVLIGDFLEISANLKPVEFLYCSCSMYIPWTQQNYFIKEVLRLSTKAVCFANLYLTDRQGIPYDSLRKVIYSSRQDFARAMSSLGWKPQSESYDFFSKAR